MSGWRLALKRLHDAGRPLPPGRVSVLEVHRQTLLRYGLAKLRREGRQYLYDITTRGHDLITGRLEFVPAKDGPDRGWRWRRTWLSALPRTDFQSTK
jgi:hypothetical protein